MTAVNKTARIAVVEDNPADIVLIKKALQERGVKFHLICFGDGETALKALSHRRHKPPALILLDLHLPTIDGLAVLRMIRNNAKTRRCSCSHPHIIRITRRSAPHDSSRRRPVSRETPDAG
jgi:CheY-like chemotaxis protein